ncbi:NAD(P)H-quinone oxidoreductase [Tellurirhabdus bombi]|uniref:NAD(P)H-quinone oxidoreductase n=1 Tax=Tellurirhabdus bombi TaxID=2907205 RepID=UPI001F484D40|nr:NAD(P)H-quinone oxidoreductase [Tellurirhabdus bombi]
MKAIVITRPGDAQVLQVQQLEKPIPAAGQVLIRIKAAGLNRSDVLQRKGAYGGTDPSGQIPGLEVAGIVDSCAEQASLWQPGDAVCALISSGGYAEYVAVDERHCLPIPATLTFEEAASLPEAAFTVWYNVFRQAGLKAGENFLVHGGSSGIGITAIQLAKAFGAIVYATAGSDEKCAFCESLGATRCINYRTEDFEAGLKEIGIDVILDMVGGEYTSKNLRILKPEGRLTFINAMKGAKTEINALEVMNKRLVISGSTLKPRSADFKAALAADVEKHVWPLVASGALKPVVHEIFPFEQAAEAQELMESSQHIGKIILNVDTEK